MWRLANVVHWKLRVLPWGLYYDLVPLTCFGSSTIANDTDNLCKRGCHLSSNYGTRSNTSIFLWGPFASIRIYPQGRLSFGVVIDGAGSSDECDHSWSCRRIIIPVRCECPNCLELVLKVTHCQGSAVAFCGMRVFAMLYPHYFKAIENIFTVQEGPVIVLRLSWTMMKGRVVNEGKHACWGITMTSVRIARAVPWFLYKSWLEIWDYFCMVLAEQNHFSSRPNKPNTIR